MKDLEPNYKEGVFEEFLKKYKTRSASHERYQCLLGPFFRWLKANTDKTPTDFDAKEIRAYLEIADTLRRESKLQLLTVIRRFINVYRTSMIQPNDTHAWQIHSMRIERMKASNIHIPPDKSPPPRQMALSIDEMNKLMEVASHNEELFIVFYLYGYFGFRKGEMRKVFRIDWDKNELEVMTSKTNVPRILYFDDVAKGILRKAVKLGLTSLGDEAIHNKFKSLAGMFEGTNRIFSANSMRHTFKTHTKNKTDDDSVTNALLGHTDKSVPGIYDHVFEDEKRKAMTELHYYRDIPFLEAQRTL